MLRNVSNGNKTIWLLFAGAALIVFGLGFLSGWFSGIHFRTEKSAAQFSEMRLNGYQYVTPLLECDGATESLDARGLMPFRNTLEDFIASKKKSTWVSHVSVYFRDMNSGIFFSIDGREKFAPASLLKVPLMIAYLKWAESNPGLLTTKLVFRGMPNQTVLQHIKPLKTIEPGKSYTIDELLYYMIVYSDNNAYFLLFSKIKPAILHNVYTDLGLVVPRVRQQTDYMTVNEYASFFRILFNASYLSKDLSEKAMHYLAQVDFKKGLVAGLPKGLTIAQKYGERTLGKQQEIKQMHDCGIVYYPGHPYLICVMTRGESFEYLDDAIKGISSLAYEEVDRQYRDVAR